MKESIENIQASISLIASEIDEIDKAVKARAVALIGEGEVDESIKMLSKVEELARIRQEVMNRLGSFEQALASAKVELSFVPTTTPDEPPATSRTTPVTSTTSDLAGNPPDQKSRKRILVHFPDGKIVTGKTGAESMALALDKMGLENVKKLGIQVSGVYLISDEKSENYSQYIIGSHYIMTNLSTISKIALLERVSKKLGVKIRIEVI